MFAYTCPECGEVVEFLCKPAGDADCNCGAFIEPLELEPPVDREVA